MGAPEPGVVVSRRHGRVQSGRPKLPSHTPSWRIAALALVLLTVSASIAHAQVGAGAFENIAPEGAVTGDEVERYPADRYSLDHFVDVGITDLDGIPALVAHTIAGLIWELTRFLVMSVISLVTSAFGFNLIAGSDGGDGAIEPVADAITALRTEVIGDEWMVVAILVTGLWATANALFRQRHSETLGRLATSALLATVAFAFVAEDQWVVRTVSTGVSDLASSALGIAAAGDPGDGDQAKEDVSNGLFEVLVVRPYAVLEFGGTEHCTNADAAAVPCDDPAVERRIDHLPERFAAASLGSTIPGQGAYLDYFLATEPGSDEREDEYEILKGEETPDDGGRVVDDHDEPAVALMEEGGAAERAGMATFVLVAELGAIVLVGLLALGVVVTQAIALLLLAFAPLFLLAALVPDAGHRLFIGWLRKLAWALVAEALLALVLAVLLAVSAALSEATSSLGFLLAFGLQAAFFWLVLLNRNRLLAVAAGHGYRAAPQVPLTGTIRGARAATSRAASTPVAALDYLTRRARDADRGSERNQAAGRYPLSSADRRPARASRARARVSPRSSGESVGAPEAAEPTGQRSATGARRRPSAGSGEAQQDGHGTAQVQAAAASGRKPSPARAPAPGPAGDSPEPSAQDTSAARLIDRGDAEIASGGQRADRAARPTAKPPTDDSDTRLGEIRVSTEDLRLASGDASKPAPGRRAASRLRRRRRDRDGP